MPLDLHFYTHDWVFATYPGSSDVVSDAEDIDSDDEDDDLSPSDGLNLKEPDQRSQRNLKARKPSNNGPVVNK